MGKDALYTVQLKGVTLTGACKPKDPMRARRELIAQYNRKPSIYVEPNVGRDCANLIGGLAASMSGFMQQALGSNGRFALGFYKLGCR